IPDHSRQVAGNLVQGVDEGPSKCCVADVDQFETRSPEKLGELIVDVLPEIWVSNTDHLRRAFFYVRHPDFPFRGKPYSPILHLFAYCSLRGFLVARSDRSRRSAGMF